MKSFPPPTSLQFPVEGSESHMHCSITDKFISLQLRLPSSAVAAVEALEGCRLCRNQPLTSLWLALRIFPTVAGLGGCCRRGRRFLLLTAAGLCRFPGVAKI